MTFLEYTLIAMLGPPLSSRDNGEHSWPCPACGSEKFHSRPPHRKYKDKFSCWKCQFWGDTMDLLRCLFPDEDHPQHVRRWKMLHEEWEQLDPNLTIEQLKRADRYRHASAPSSNPNPSTTAGSTGFLPGLRGQREGTPESQLYAVYEQMGNPIKFMLKNALAFAEQHNVDLTDLARYTRAVDDWVRETDEIHRRLCEDPDCDTAVCRRARGLPPLSEAEIAELRQQTDEERRRFNEEMEGCSRQHRKWAWKNRDGRKT